MPAVAIFHRWKKISLKGCAQREEKVCLSNKIVIKF